MSYSSEVLADSPVAYYRMNQSSGLIQDSSGNANHATSTLGTPTYSQAGLLPSTESLAIRFTAAEAEGFSVPDHATLDVGNTFTLEAWINPTTTATDFQAVFTKGTNAYYLRLSGAAIELHKVTYGSVASSSQAVVAGIPNHVVVTWNAGSPGIWINNENVLTSVGPGTFEDNTEALTIGRRAAGSEPFDGVIDEIAIYATALSPARVAAHYYAGQITASTTSHSRQLRKVYFNLEGTPSEVEEGINKTGSVSQTLSTNRSAVPKATRFGTVNRAFTVNRSAVGDIGADPSAILPEFGIANGFTILTRTSANMDYELDRCVEVGAKWVRFDCIAGGWEDEIALAGAKAIARGLKLMLILHGTTTPRTYQQAYDWARAQAIIWQGQPVVYEFCNEPDLNGWTGTQYGTAIQGCWDGLKSIDASAKLLAGAIFKCAAQGGMAQFITDMYAAGAQGHFDAVSVHLYDDPAWNNPDNGWYMTFGPGNNIRSVMNANGDSAKPIICTEAGATVNQVSEAVQAQRVAAMMADGRCESIAIYTMMNDAVPGFGLLRDNLTKRPAWDSYALAASDAPKNNLMATRLSTNTVETGGDLTRYGYVAMNPWYYGAGLNQRNAGVKTLAYKDMSSSRSTQTVDTAGGVLYSTAPDAWFLKKSGVRIQWSGFSNHWQMDIGHPDYQQAWVDQVLANLDSHPGSWSGVIVDNANMSPGSDYFTFPTDLYATASAYAAATREFLSVVGPQIQAAGYLFIPNFQHHGTLLTEALWRDWVQFCSGAHLENYTKWGTANADWITGGGWETSGQAFVKASQELDKIFLGTFRAPINATQSMNYARASFLIDWDGGPSALCFDPEPPAQDPWTTVWTKSIGTPTGSRVLNAGWWERNYTGGQVRVNPTTATGQVNSV